MDQREANREAKRAALFLLPVEAPMPDDVDDGDARRLREGWARMRGQLAAAAPRPGPVDDPDQLAAWSLVDLCGPLCGEHDAPVAQVQWGPLVDGLPDTWRRIRFACGCEREPGVADPTGVG